MRNRIDTSTEMPGFWPPKRSGAWMRLLRPLHRRVMRRLHAIDAVDVVGLEHIDRLGPRDGVLVCPNHSYTGDGSVIVELAMRCRSKPLHFMAAWHVFRENRGVNGWLIQRAGGFSVDREGCDRRAIRTAIELLGSGNGLIVFPEGEIYHLNEQLTPLREGVAFMATSAQRDLDKAGSDARVWMVPAAIRYEFADPDVTRARLETAMSELERRVMIRPRPGATLPERVVRYGEAMLTLQEKQHLGRSYDDDGQTLPGRLEQLMTGILDRLEREHFNGKARGDESVPVRVKLLRQHLLDELCETPTEAAPASAAPVDRQAIHTALDDVHLVLQLFSYPGDYITARPSVERMAETIEKFEEDVYGTYAEPKGRRRARLTLGEPIDVKAQLAAGGKARAVMGDLTTKLEEAIRRLMRDGPSSAVR